MSTIIDRNIKKSACPCGSKLPYSACCEIYHAHHGTASTAEALMRSRYSAYAFGHYDYVLATYASEFRQGLSEAKLAESDTGTQWLNLEVLSEQSTETDATVVFKAISLQDQRFYLMHECSQFVFREGQWFYTTGDIQSDSGELKLGRNDLCPCKSGKKVKRCCRR